MSQSHNPFLDIPKPKYYFGNNCKYRDIESFIIGIAFRGTALTGYDWFYLLDWDEDQWIRQSELTLID